MSGRPARLDPSLLSVLLVTALVLACSGGGVRAKGELATATPAQESAQPTAVSGVTAPPATAQPTATLPTPAPPTATPAPAGGISFSPAQIPQGGAAVVYLNEQATSATLTFRERQYPMLQAGGHWWAVIGVGAIAEPGLHPVSVSYTPSGSSAAMSVVASIAVTDRDFPVEYIELDSQTAALLAPEIVNAEISQRAAIFAGYTMQRFWSGAFVVPASGALSGHYGEGRSYNGAPATDYHRGTDFAGEIGAPVYAAASGRVVFTGELQVRGNAIILDHGAGVFTAYHHLSSSAVAQGQTVTAGQSIGAIGSTGLVTGPHLHWEVIVRGVEVDGELWLTGQEVGP